MADEAVWNTPGVQDAAHAALQFGTVARDGLQSVCLVQDLQGFLRRSQRHGMAGEGTAMRHAVAHLAHDVLAPRHHRNRVSVTHGLGEGAQVGLEAHQFLDPAAGHAKAGFHFVHDHDHVVFFAKRLCVVDIFAGRGNGTAVTHHRLDQEGADVPVMALQQVFQVVGVIERREMRQLFQYLRNALAVRLDRGIAGGRVPFLDVCVPEHGIEQAVVAAFDDDV